MFATHSTPATRSAWLLLLSAAPLSVLLATAAPSAASVHPGAAQLQLPLRGAQRHHAKYNYLAYSSFSFPQPTQGSFPQGYAPAEGVTTVGTDVYAVTTGGGAYAQGTVLKIARNLLASTATVQYPFGQTNNDGSGPSNAPILIGSKLVGTVQSGGAGGFGGTYTFDTANPLSPYSFYPFNGTGPTQPTGPLVLKSGSTYYGVSNAGPTGHGTFYKVVNNVASLCVAFNGLNGNNELGNLVKDGNFYYGVAPYGGTIGGGQGVVFKIKQNCQLMWTYSFGGPGDGFRPEGGLVQVGTGSAARFYGTTSAGGTNGTGTIFWIDANKNESVVYNFPPSNGTSGNTPSGSIMLLGTALIGTTTYGGGTCVTNGTGGCGTVYSYTLPASPTSYNTLHVFQGGTADGYFPKGVSYNPTVNGIYGTTAFGGSGFAGTIWSLVCPSCQ
jgi:uncharacterized repeat protein (TIGR03803 family)